MADRAFEAADVEVRFRRESDWFVASRERGIHIAQIGTTGERAVDLLPALAFHLDPAVSLAIDSLRDGVVFEGERLPLPDVRETIGRLRLPLAMYGGVEVTLWTPEDQLTLTPELAIVIYARTDRWLFLLDGMGLTERPHRPAPVWTPAREHYRETPDLTAALRAAAERLGLREAPRSTAHQTAP